jgi:hypothetical protein
MGAKKQVAKKYQKISFFLAAIILISTIISVLATPLNVSAASFTKSNNYTPEQQALSMQYLTSLSMCFAWGMSKYGEQGSPGTGYSHDDGDAAITSTRTDPSAEQIFSAKSNHTSAYINGQEKSCGSIFTDAMALWSWGGGTGSFLREALGCDLPTGTGSDAYIKCGKTRTQNFIGAVLTQVYGISYTTNTDSKGPDINLKTSGIINNAGLYAMYIETLKNACSGKDYGTPAEIQARDNASGRTSFNDFFKEDTVDNNTSYKTINLAVSPGGQALHGVSFGYNITTTFVDTAVDSENYINIYGHETETNGQVESVTQTANNTGLTSFDTRMTCTDIAANINTYAPDYASYLTYYPGAQVTRLPFTQNSPTADIINSTNDNKTACAVDGVGWIVCPVLTFLGGLADKAFDFLANNFLDTKVSLLNSDPSKGNTGAYSAWQAMRNIANIIFVIAFLMIIFSQITNFGIDNYGIKKMLPKLIIAAVLVNLSFYICQIAVDLSNIVGYSLGGLFDGIINSIQIPATSNPVGVAFGWAAVVIAALAGGVALLLCVTVPVLLAVLGALLMTVLILLARTALIVILVVISPLAFVAYLLPNAESLFKKWTSTFTSLLLVFPVIALLFGGGKLAAQILNSSAGDDWLLRLIAMGVGAIPLLAVPSLLKNSISSAGSIGKTLSGWSDKASGKIGGKVKETSRLGQYQQYRKKETDTRRALIRSGAYVGHGGKLNPRNLMSMTNKYANNKLGKFGGLTSASGVALADKVNKENIELAASKLNDLRLTQDENRDLAIGKTVRGIDGNKNIAMRQAAIKQMVASNDIAGINTLWDDTTKMPDDGQNEKFIRNTFADSLMASSARPTYLGAGAIAGMRGHTTSQVFEKNIDGTDKLDFNKEKIPAKDASGKFIFKYDQEIHTDTISSAIKSGAYSAEKIARADKEELKKVNEVLSTGAAGDEATKLIKANANKAINDPILSAAISKNRVQVEEMAKANQPQQSDQIEGQISFHDDGSTH